MIPDLGILGWYSLYITGAPPIEIVTLRGGDIRARYQAEQDGGPYSRAQCPQCFQARPGIEACDLLTDTPIGPAHYAIMLPRFWNHR